MRKEILRKILICPFLFLCLPLLSCPTENPQSLLIEHIAAVLPTTGCMVVAEGGGGGGGGGGAGFRSFGVLDLSITNQYWVAPRFKNMLPTLEEITGESYKNLQSETNYLIVQGAWSYIDAGDYWGLKPSVESQKLMDYYQYEGYHAYVAYTVQPQREGIVVFQAVPPNLGNALQSTLASYAKKSGVNGPGIWITVTIKLDAITQDKTVVHSNEFSFPILTCWGCLVRCISDDPDVAPEFTQIPCFLGQDDPISNIFCKRVAMYPEACDCAP